jgi:hypothetical protein
MAWLITVVDAAQGREAKKSRGYVMWNKWESGVAARRFVGCEKLSVMACGVEDVRKV